jgi:hypothetical protein
LEKSEQSIYFNEINSPFLKKKNTYSSSVSILFIPSRLDSTRLRPLNAFLNPIHNTLALSLITTSPLMIARLHGPSPLRLEYPSRDTSPFEQMINILELQLISLGEKAVHDRHPEGA